MRSRLCCCYSRSWLVYFPRRIWRCLRRMLNENHRRLAADVSLGGVDKPTMRMIATLMTPLKIPGRWLTFRRYISRWWPNKNLIINNGENTDGRRREIFPFLSQSCFLALKTDINNFSFSQLSQKEHFFQ